MILIRVLLLDPILLQKELAEVLIMVLDLIRTQLIVLHVAVVMALVVITPATALQLLADCLVVPLIGTSHTEFKYSAR